MPLTDVATENTEATENIFGKASTATQTSSWGTDISSVHETSQAATAFRKEFLRDLRVLRGFRPFGQQLHDYCGQ